MDGQDNRRPDICIANKSEEQIISNLKPVEYVIQIILGTKPLSDFDKSVDLWYKQDGGEVTSRAQEFADFLKQLENPTQDHVWACSLEEFPYPCPRRRERI
ncbi:MAG: hypothetical protein JXA95_05325 [Spirochaetales bacterium]|nr:hypothetical protein [Spirochaetales bacterium]